MIKRGNGKDAAGRGGRAEPEMVAARSYKEMWLYAPHSLNSSIKLTSNEFENCLMHASSSP